MAKSGIVDIAKRAKVSPAAVSRALRGGEGLSTETHKRILRIAQEFDYQLKLPRHSLRKIALLTPHRPRPMDSFFFRETYNGLSDGLFSAGATLVHIPWVGSLSDGTLVRRLRSEGIDTAVLLYQTMKDHLAECLNSEGIYTIGLASTLEAARVTVDYDNVGGVETLIKHLTALGHRYIGLIFAEPDFKHHAERIGVYQRVMKEMGSDSDPRPQVQAISSTKDDGKYAALQLLQQYPECTAIFAINDRLAFGACQAVQMSGRQIPNETAVAGFDDVDLASFFTPTLTTVQVPYWKMANMATLLINQYLETGEFPKEKIIEPTQLVIRESTWSGKKWASRSGLPAPVELEGRGMPSLDGT